MEQSRGGDGEKGGGLGVVGGVVIMAGEAYGMERMRGWTTRWGLEEASVWWWEEVVVRALYIYTKSGGSAGVAALAVRQM